mmetsp:Transcript_9776/g.23216  ORF Transcript_9776/g.23216 Transcript_9776/m.23216 type:complete len:432 (+) Transcript_9776:518-1813(+)
MRCRRQQLERCGVLRGKRCDRRLPRLYGALAVLLGDGERRCDLLQRRHPPQREADILLVLELRAPGGESGRDVALGDELAEARRHAGGGQRQPLHDAPRHQHRPAERRAAKELGSREKDHGTALQTCLHFTRLEAALAGVDDNKGVPRRYQLAEVGIRKALIDARLTPEHAVHDRHSVFPRTPVNSFLHAVCCVHDVALCLAAGREGDGFDVGGQPLQRSAWPHAALVASVRHRDHRGEEAAACSVERARSDLGRAGDDVDDLAAFPERLGDEERDVLGVAARGAREDFRARRQRENVLQLRPHALHDVAHLHLIGLDFLECALGSRIGAFCGDVARAAAAEEGAWDRLWAAMVLVHAFLPNGASVISTQRQHLRVLYLCPHPGKCLSTRCQAGFQERDPPCRWNNHAMTSHAPSLSIEPFSEDTAAEQLG